MSLAKRTSRDVAAEITDLIIRKLEEGDMPLETSLELYERGVALSRYCHGRLEAAERRIDVLNERGEPRPAPAALGLDADDEA